VAFGAVLDACVLYPASLRDLLLRLAAAEAYDLVWSERILEEARRNLVADGRATAEGAQRLVDAMREAFDGAAVDDAVIGRLKHAMGCDSKDNHVAAAAVAAGAELIITSNLKDFSAEALDPLGIEAVSPDDFLDVLFHISPAATVDLLRRQAADLRNPPMTFDEVLDRLERTVPSFVAQVRRFALEHPRPNPPSS
jgi:predicted nucleic acid-binding protein